MKDQLKTKQQLITELEELRRKIAEIKPLEEEHKRSEAASGQLTAIVQSSDDGIIGNTLEGIILSWNQGAERIYGYSSSETIGRHISILVPHNHPDEVSKFLERIERGERIERFETMGRRKDGQLIHVSLTTSPVKDRTGTIVGVSTIANDITEHKQAEEALRESESKFRALAESSSAAIFLIQGNKYLYINPAFTAMTGYTSEDLVSMNFWDFISPDMRELVKARGIGRQRKEDIPPRYDLKFITKSGEERFGDFGATLIEFQNRPAILGSVFDITERKRIEEALRESEERLRLLFDEAPVGYHEVDTEGRVIRINRTELDLLGYCLEDVIGRPIWRLCVDEEAVIKAFKNKIAGKVPAGRAFERCYRRKDGTPLPVLSEDRILRDKDGRITGIRTTIQDITEGKRAEKALQESEEQARELAQENAIMAEIGRIISSTPNIDEVYERFAQQVRKLITFDRISINLIDHEARTATAAYISGRGVKGRQIGDVSPLEGTAAEEVIRTHSGLFLHPEDKEELEGRFPGLVPSFQAGHRSMMVVPLISKGKVIADLYFGSAKSNSFSDRDLRLAELIGAQIAGTIANAQLFIELKQMEQVLRASEERFRELFDHAPVSYHEIDLEGRIARVNYTELEMLGYAHEEMIGQPIWKYNAEEEPARKRVLGKLAGDISPSKGYELTYRRKDGATISLLAEDRLILDSEGRITGMRGIFQDITDRKRAEETIRRMAQRFRIMLSTQHYGIVVADENNRIEFVNEAFCEEFALAQGPSPWIGYRAEDFIPLILPAYADPPGTLARLQKIVAAGQPVLGEEVVMRDGRTFLVDFTPIVVAGIPSGRMWQHRDITERKRTEEALRKSEEKYRDLYDRAPVGYHEYDTEGRITSVNRTELEMLGYTAEEMIGQFIWKFSVEEEASQQVLSKLAGTLPPAKTLERAYRRRDGATVPVMIENQLVLDEKGRIKSIRSTVQDIAERKRVEEDRKNLEARLQRMEKMEALGTLAGGVAHDLNNILSGLVGYPDLILMQLPEGSPLRKPVLGMKQSGQKSAAIVQDLLTLTRRGMVSMEVVNLNHVISDYMKTPEQEKTQSFHGGVRFEVSLESDLLPIKGSPVHLSKTVMNLLSNAAEAIPDTGVVTISTRNQYLDRPIKGYDHVKEGDYVVLEVSDTGRGISTEDMGRIFEPFYTKKKMGRSGSGLGLAVVWGTVKDHNGYIDAQSQEGRGTTFRLYFPVTREALTQDQPPVSLLDCMGKGETILVVDDVMEQRELAVAMLSKLLYKVTSVSSGEAAVEYMKTGQADLLILDMIMDPGIDGLETYRRILEIHPRQRAIIASGFSETERVGLAQALGAGAFLRKPYILEKIGLLVRQELDKYPL